VRVTARFDGVVTQVCQWCVSTVPVGRFCGCCGARLEGGERFPWLRPREYAVSPRESVFLPMITSSLFPHLAQPSRNPFRLAMAIMLVGLVCGSVLRTLGLLVSLAALGVPLLFVLYLWQSEVYQGMPRRVLAVAALLGASLGAGWVVLTGGLIARSYGIPMAAGFVLENVLNIGLVVSVGGALLMVLPAVIVRLMRPPVHESLDGFVIGALGALTFTGAATIARLGPQYVAGLLKSARPVRVLVESVLYGVASPLTAAAVGGLIGIVLWFRPGEWAGVHPARVRAFLGLFTAQLGLIYTALWLIDSSRLPQVPQLMLHILMTVLALIALRLGVQMALLHEKPDPSTGQPLLCLHCERVVPDMPFCPACGVAARASSRASRRQCRESPPVRDETDVPPDESV
jgi:hypothetical protein